MRAINRRTQARIAICDRLHRLWRDAHRSFHKSDAKLCRKGAIKEAFGNHPFRKQRPIGRNALPARDPGSLDKLRG